MLLAAPPVSSICALLCTCFHCSHCPRPSTFTARSAGTTREPWQHTPAPYSFPSPTLRESATSACCKQTLELLHDPNFNHESAVSVVIRWKLSDAPCRESRRLSTHSGHLRGSLMALAEVYACARGARFVVLVLLGSALIGLCLPHVLPPVITERYSHTSFKSSGISNTSGLDNASPSASRSQINVSVRTVALKHGDVRVGEVEPTLQESFESDDVKPSWEATGTTRRELSGESEAQDVHRLGKRMMVRRRARSLRTSKPYPCSLPLGTNCQRAEVCCGSTCTNVAVNRNHCGRCGHICRSDRACCNGKCRRLATDERNCGRCGSRCALGTKCLFGLCGYWTVVSDKQPEVVMKFYARITSVESIYSDQYMCWLLSSLRLRRIISRIISLSVAQCSWG